MSFVERNQFGYPVFEAVWPEFTRRRVREHLERTLRCPTACSLAADDQLVELERLWIDVGGEG
jgi:hypothetical protein